MIFRFVRTKRRQDIVEFPVAGLTDEWIYKASQILKNEARRRGMLHRNGYIKCPDATLQTTNSSVKNG